ncbi:MAG: GGDEF domain-containing protein [Lachnospiraceae bacterium]|nr:GGDEF domain-containing protein [Lachnospiraceae bacterium]
MASYQMFDRLRILSTMDMLTGVYNRNEMNNRIDRMCEGEDEGRSVGIVFADLNGLKQVNDRDGHLAGDLLLKNAAMLLQNIFVGNEIYRAGGDEFMVLVEDAVPQVLEYQVERVKKQSEAYRNVSFAVGFCCEKDGRDVRKALKIADQRMYEDKKRYYELYPERKR